MATKYIVGTSGWMYRDWNGTFYPKQVTGTAQLAYYAQHFPSVEINSTFYHMPKAATAAHWRQTTPADFCFSIKINRYITHTKRLLADDDMLAALDSFVQATSELKEKFGVMLVQLPPSMRHDSQRLIDFIKAYQAAAKKHSTQACLAFEFRHASWFNSEIKTILKEYGAAQVINDSPGRWPADKSVPSDIAYIRFHGSKRLYRSSYTDEELSDWATFIRTECADCKTVFAYFNNDYNAVAVNNAQTLTRLLQSE